MNPTKSIAQLSTPAELRQTLGLWHGQHAAHEDADETWRLLDIDLKLWRQHAAAEAATNAECKNAEQRASFSSAYLATNCRELLDLESKAATGRRAAAAELERLTEHLKTLRAILRYETAEREAQTAVAQAEAFANLPF